MVGICPQGNAPRAQVHLSDASVGTPAEDAAMPEGYCGTEWAPECNGSRPSLRFFLIYRNRARYGFIASGLDLNHLQIFNLGKTQNFSSLF